MIVFNNIMIDLWNFFNVLDILLFSIILFAFSILRYIILETTAKDGFDLNAMPEKGEVEVEKDMMDKWRGVLQMFLHDNTALQITAIYAVQVLCYNFKFPKGKKKYQSAIIPKVNLLGL